MSDNYPTPLWPSDFPVHPQHCADVVHGCYDVPLEIERPTILDIGANIGAFARWANDRWPDSTIFCYEPHPQNFFYLERTVASIPNPSIFCTQVAVLNRYGEFDLLPGKFNCGEWSLFGAPDVDKEKKIPVPVMDAKKLPRADIMKIDTEGAEPFILRRLIECGHIKYFSAIMLEYHREGEDKSIPEMLEPHGFKLHSHKTGISESRGELKFLKT